ncbi:MAG: hypothetical protein NTZ34_03400 [Chloroflexi bacterium]|nr:hypothetical protein [Chloroflexota bacterium]
MSKDNPVRTTANVWWIITAIFLVLFFVPIIFHLDGGFSALIFIVSFIITLTAFFVALLVYMPRARLVDKLLRGEGTLAHWTYSADEWQQFAENDYKEEQKADIKRLMIFSGFGVLVLILCLVIRTSMWGWGIAIMLLTIIAGGLIPWLFHWFSHKQSMKYPGEAYIGRDGAYLKRKLHMWTKMGYQFGSVKYAGEKPASLVFTYYTPNSTDIPGVVAKHKWQVRVPVPQGQEASAKELMEQFKK